MFSRLSNCVAPTLLLMVDGVCGVRIGAGGIVVPRPPAPRALPRPRPPRPPPLPLLPPARNVAPHALVLIMLPSRENSVQWVKQLNRSFLHWAWSSPFYAGRGPVEIAANHTSSSSSRSQGDIARRGLIHMLRSSC